MKKAYPSIYNHNDFREFLKEYQKARQDHDSTFTKSEFSRLLHLPNTRSYFIDVIKGKRVTHTFTERFINVINFSSNEEANYFRILVKFNQSINENERAIYFKQLITHHITPQKIINNDTLEYYSEWHNSAIRAILELIDFEDNYLELAQKVFPPINVTQAKKSIALLIKLKLIKKDKRGYYKPTEKSISSEEFSRNELIKNYQLKCLDQVKKSIIINKKYKQIVATNTISVSNDALKKIMDKINDFRSDVRSIVDKDENKAEKVYQLDVIFFPNSK